MNTNQANQTFSAHEAVELAVVDRSGFVESRHVGAAVVLAPDGSVVAHLGETRAPVLTRSCLKPLQAIACMDSGVQLAGKQAVLATASHIAQREHVEVVQSMLDRGELNSTDLQCPAVTPADPDNRVYARKHGMEKSSLYFNCSGKHAAFLLAQKLAGEPTQDYLDPESFIQRQVLKTVTEYCETAPVFTGVDGCGAPVHALGLTALARGIARVASGATLVAATLTRAVLEHPWAIEGNGKPNSEAIAELGVFAKFGAEGVLVMATTDGYCAAVKTLDGAYRANSFVALTLLAHVGAIDAERAVPLAERITPAVTGGVTSDGRMKTVGVVRAGAGLAHVVRA